MGTIEAPVVMEEDHHKRPLSPTSAATSQIAKKPRRKATVEKVTVKESKEKEKIKKGKDSDENSGEDMEWVCALCKEAECMLEPDADEFLICDGGCRRVFHYPCAGLQKIPDGDKEWICTDCSQSRHQCAFCGEYGKDQIDVFSCRKAKCGLFFHEACLELNNVPVKMEILSNDIGAMHLADSMDSPRNVDAAPLDDEENSVYVPTFTCPAHRCWTCSQEEELQRERIQAEEKKKGGSNKKKRGKKKKVSSIFICKSESRLFRCLYCPLAYHVTCLPPTSKVNELGILCPEHALSHKLPDVDPESSIQRTVEDKIEQKLDKARGRNRARRLIHGLGGSGATANSFFPGLRADRILKVEQECAEYLKNSQNSLNTAKTEDTVIDAIAAACGHVAFCLPVEIKNDVHSKPPKYTHLHNLRYDAAKRPKRIPGTGEQCQCTESCDSRCFNRMSLIECCGDGPNSNCRLGPAKCDNRALGKRQFVKCKPKREGGKGWGLITQVDIPKGRVVQEYIGEVIDEAEKERRLIDWNLKHPNDPNFYVMGLGIGWYVDAREYANMSRFINHSCGPNCEVVTINVRGFKRNAIFALRDIKANEFLSYDYHFDTKQGDRFSCRCGAPNCRGTMQGGGGLDGDKKVMTWKEAKTKYDSDARDLVNLNSKQITSQVDALVPEAEQPSDFVSSGLVEMHRSSAFGLFLWRNAIRGSDFLSRSSRIQKYQTQNSNISK